MKRKEDMKETLAWLKGYRDGYSRALDAMERAAIADNLGEETIKAIRVFKKYFSTNKKSEE